MLAAEVYGGPIISSWQNRDLGIAGRVVYTNKKGDVVKNVVNITEYPAIIPQLAIHLDDTRGEDISKLNKHDQFTAIGCLDTEFDDDMSYLEALIESQVEYKELLAAELFFYPLQPAALVGNRELIASYRLDNLASVHAAVTALIAAKRTNQTRLQIACLWDHEEIGSQSYHSAASPFLDDTLDRIAGCLKMDSEDLLCLKSQSHCLSLDAVHARNPNFPNSTDKLNEPELDKGIVIKHNANQRYAYDAYTCAVVQKLANKHEIPIQTFVNRNDKRAGSTVGPIAATRTGIRCLDMGLPMLSMHSAREIISAGDHVELCKFLIEFLQTKDDL